MKNNKIEELVDVCLDAGITPRELRDYVTFALVDTLLKRYGNVNDAAKALGMHRNTLARWTREGHAKGLVGRKIRKYDRRAA